LVELSREDANGKEEEDCKQNQDDWLLTLPVWMERTDKSTQREMRLDIGSEH
jgi:hypothetical protein